jgi:hypothetical protein
MDNKEILVKLKNIIKKIKENGVDAWEDNLEDTVSVVVLDDFTKGVDDDEKEVTEYNGWLEDLEKLAKDLDFGDESLASIIFSED